MKVTENSVIHIEGLEKSANNILVDCTAQSMWVAEFSVTNIFWSGFTLGLCNRECIKDALKIVLVNRHCVLFWSLRCHIKM
jgi:hypothetical protein